MQPDWITYIPTPAAKMQGPRAWLNKTDYRLALSVQELEEYVHPYLLKGVSPGLDWETTGLNVWKDHLVGLCVSFATGQGMYVPIAHYVGAEYNLPLAGVLNVLRAIDAADVEQQWYNYRFDSPVMLRDLDGWEPTFGKWRDVMFAAYLENPNIKQYGLKFTAGRLLGVEMIEYTELVGDGHGFHMVHPEKAPPYACADADMTRRIRYLPEIQAALKDQPLIWDIEHKTLLPIREAVEHGCWLDAARLRVQQREIGGVVRRKGQPTVVLPGLVAEARKKIFAAAGGEFDLDSPQQLGQTLVALGIEIVEKTEKTKQVATGQEILAKYAEKYPFVKEITKYKKLDKQRRDYIDKMLAWVEKFGPHVRFAFNQIGAPTGRMSAGGEGQAMESGGKGYADVNVQSIPDHEKEDYLPNIRSAFVANDPRIGEIVEQVERDAWLHASIDSVFHPERTDDHPALEPRLREALRAAGLSDEDLYGDEWVMVSIDYSQIELRVAANIFREPIWIDSFLRGEDIHTTNARLAYRDPAITKKDPRRKMGKTMNFATLYGAQPETVAEHGGIAVAKAKEMLENFFGQATKLRDGIESLKRAARANKSVKTWFGRKRPLDAFFGPDAKPWQISQGEREAVNSPIQGGAADIFKIACFKVRGTLIRQGWTKDWYPVLFVHDELVSLVRRATLYEMLPVVVAAMEFPVKGWPVPIKADPEVGWNWGEMMPWADWTTQFPPSTARERLVSWVKGPTTPVDSLYKPEDATSLFTGAAKADSDAAVVTPGPRHAEPVPA